MVLGGTGGDAGKVVCTEKGVDILIFLPLLWGTEYLTTLEFWDVRRQKVECHS